MKLLALAISGVFSAAHSRGNDLECYYQSKFDSEISDIRRCDTSGHHSPICFSLQLPDIKDYPTEKGCKGEGETRECWIKCFTDKCNDDKDFFEKVTTTTTTKSTTTTASTSGTLTNSISTALTFLILFTRQ